MTTRKQQESFLLGFITLGIVSIVAVFVGGLAYSFDSSSSPTAAADQDVASETDVSATATGPGSAAAPLIAGEAESNVLDAFAAGGCVACHTIKGVGGAGATIGPPLMRTGAIAASRRPGPTVEDYIKTSITDPDAFIMPNCPTGPCSAGLMPKTLADTLTTDQIESIVNYLAVLGTDREGEVLPGG